ncbi:MAG TPA: hypothetical protein VNT60_10365, partial [Deinococcales bacterium]|nr:hypothetical protein [Deinococcales bacterium]
AGPLLEAQLHASDALEGAEVPLVLFLARAALRAGAEGAGFGAVGVAIADDDGLTPLEAPGLDGSFREAARQLATSGRAGSLAGLAVVDASDLVVDELVTPVPGGLLCLGQLRDGGEGETTATLVLSGSFPLRAGARFLNRVAELLESPIALVI